MSYGIIQVHFSSASPHLSHCACIFLPVLQVRQCTGSKTFAIKPHPGHFQSGAGPPQTLHSVLEIRVLTSISFCMHVLYKITVQNTSIKIYHQCKTRGGILPPPPEKPLLCFFVFLWFLFFFSCVFSFCHSILFLTCY